MRAFLDRLDSGGSYASSSEQAFSSLAKRLKSLEARVAVLGIGYAGLPMAVELARSGYQVSGLDVNQDRVRSVNDGRSPVSGVSDAEISSLVGSGRLTASNQFGLLAETDCILICVPTPLVRGRKPDFSYVESAANSIADYMRPGQLIILQSTCSPGTTRNLLLPILERKSGLRVGEDFFVAFAPERIDPGNTRYTVRNTPKIVAGVTPGCTELARLFFMPVVDIVETGSCPEVAEMCKLLENTFRFVNISFINEMALICDRLGIDIWEVIQTASSKPFAFLPHYPGPGVGGPCIPVVPFFLEAVARQSGVAAHMIEASDRINKKMPGFVVAKMEKLLAERGQALNGASVLMLGVSYKPDVGDMRESPALRVLTSLRRHRAVVSYYDPYVPAFKYRGRVLKSLSENDLTKRRFDCAVLLTQHQSVDYQKIAKQVGVILDTRDHLGDLAGADVVRI